MEKVTPFYGMKFAIIRYELNRNTYIYLIKAIGIGNGKSASETHCRAVVIVLFFYVYYCVEKLYQARRDFPVISNGKTR